jgi:hypothetical protein
MAEPSTYRVADGGAVDWAAAMKGWTRAALRVLERVAATYGATVRYQALAEEVQAATGIRTRTDVSSWVSSMLDSVDRICHRRRQPLLSSLVVSTDGTVGPAYAAVIQELRGFTPPDPDLHAAGERLDCYRYFGADIPPDDGEAGFTPLPGRRIPFRASGSGDHRAEPPGSPRR